jgi:hypothetical protein
MSILKRLGNWFSRHGRDDNRLQIAMDHAHAKRPAEAIAVYDSIVDATGGSPSLRAMALFNRALAHSALKNDEQAIQDLEAVVSLPGTPENVLSAARNQLVRVRSRVQRVKDKNKS